MLYLPRFLSKSFAIPMIDQDLTCTTVAFRSEAGCECCFNNYSLLMSLFGRGNLLTFGGLTAQNRPRYRLVLGHC
jgi:hypothetical protein